MSDEAKWPHEIWLAELDDIQQGVGMVALSPHATAPRWEGDAERDRNWQHYIDADVYAVAERYYKGEILKLRADKEAAEAKLAKAVGIMQRVKDFRYDPNIGVELNLLEAALAELEGDDG